MMDSDIATPTRREILQAARTLLGVCDGAHARDGAGYNGHDSVIARSILSSQKPTDRQLIALHGILRKYRGQLEGLGVSYEALVPPPQPPPKTDDRRAGALKEDVSKGVRMSLVETPRGRLVAIEFPYEARYVEAVRVAPKRWFDKDGSISGKKQAWLVEPGLQTLGALAAAFEKAGTAPELSPEVLEVLARGQAAYAESRADQADLEVPTKLPPYPFQRAGIKWIDDRDGRALVGDEPGLGKSLQALGWLSLRRERALPALVLCPATLRINWVREAAKFTDFKVLVLAGKSSIRQIRALGVDCSEAPLPGYDLVVANYDLLQTETVKSWVKWLLGTDPEIVKIARAELVQAGRRAVKALEIALQKHADMESRGRLSSVLSEIHALGDRARGFRDPEHVRVYVNDVAVEDFMLGGWKTLVCDEAHYLKEEAAQRSMAAAELSRRIPHAICLTGTPIMNRPREIWHQTQIVRPDLFPKFWDFGRTFCGGHQTRFGWDFSGASNLQELDRILRSSIMIRRTKDQVLKELPDKTIVTIPFVLDDRLEKKYRKDVEPTLERLAQLKRERDEWRALMSSMKEDERKAYLAKHAESALKAGRLAGQMLEDLDKVKKSALDVKFDMVMKFVLDQQEQEGKVLVFATHHDTIDRLVEGCRKAGVRADAIDGRVPPGKRDPVKDAFQAGDLEVLVCGIRAAGEGLTLTASHTVVFSELDWTPSRHTQAEDRTHRMGQRSAVTVYYLVAMGTIEESIARMIDAKREVVNSTVGESDRTVEEAGILDAILGELLGGPK